ncbi:aminodeoxychorismate synthase component I [Geomonas sp. Red276]
MTEQDAYVHGLLFAGKVCAFAASTPDEVLPVLRMVEQRVAQGLFAAGFVCYEAAGALNEDLACAACDAKEEVAGGLPLLSFSLYASCTPAPVPPCPDAFQISGWESSLDQEGFSAAVGAVRDFIKAGDCYQVNLTFRQTFDFSGSPRAFFRDLCLGQPTPYSSYLECANHRIVSASPELFFSLGKGGLLTTRPMKGTARRGRWSEEDATLKEALRESAKDRAENLMIVDLLRNDMGIVSEVGSVRVTSLFDVESHPTVHQMTSTIESQVREGVGFTGILAALFPCGSVTGAPKRRSMEIIAGLEGRPRGVYTGCIGYLLPGGEAKFSVAIRTAVLDLASGRGEIGVGSGITFDSGPRSEYAESLSKGRFARERRPDFHLIESLLHDGSFFLLESHLERLADSAGYFSFPFEADRVRQALLHLGQGLVGAHKVRVVLFRDGKFACEAAPIVPLPEAKVTLSDAAVGSSDPFLYHKTSRRDLYAKEMAAHPEVDEVIFVNERGEVTEGTTSNVVAVIGGSYLTPPLASGLLPGVFRRALLEEGTIAEALLTPRDLEEAERLYLINSVRKWRPARLLR